MGAHELPGVLTWPLFALLVHQDWKDITAGPGSGQIGACAHTRVPVEGQPWCNSHYTRQLWVWATILSLTRQEWDAASRSLRLVISHKSQSAAGGVGEAGAAGSGLVVMITDAVLHWFPRTQRLVCAAGTMRVRRVVVVDDGAGRSLSTECIGRCDVVAGGILSLDTCQLSLDGLILASLF